MCVKFYERLGICMKSTGVVRQIDPLGRVVLPIEIRNTLDIHEKDGLEIFVEEDRIILKKYQPACIFCAEVRGVASFGGKLLCRDCIRKIKEQF